MGRRPNIHSKSIAPVATAALLALAGCDGSGTGTLRWTAELTDESVRSSVARIEGRVLEGDCLSEDAVEETDLEEGEARDLPADAREGDFGLAARALDDGGEIVAAGCVHASLPVKESRTAVVPLRPMDGEVGCVAETCNGRDDDCDGAIDEAFDFDTDPDNCGYCGKSCELGCEEGHCLEEAIEVAAGSGHTCALRRSGHVYCWGANSDGQLGEGRTYSKRECEDGKMGAAAEHCALGNAVRVRTEDGGEDGGLPPSVELTGVVDIDLGRDHGCAVRDDGRALCWGDGQRGRLGDGTSVSRTRAVPVVDSSDAPIAGVTQIAAGDWITCARHDDGGVSCWGTIGRTVSDDNGNGLVDIADFIGASISARHHAEDMGGLAGVENLDVGYMHGCAVSGGQVLCWGTNDFGELGDGSSGRDAARESPAPVPGIDDAVDVAVGARHSCALHEDGTVSCWGINDDNELGDGRNDHSSCEGRDCSLTPVPVDGLDDAIQVSAGTDHCCALRASGQVVCWGSNAAGELGNETTVPSGVPVDVELETGEFIQVVDIAAGINGSFPHSCAVMDYGVVQCWGSNWIDWEGDPPMGTKWGRLGNVEHTASKGDRSTTPIRVDGIP